MTTVSESNFRVLGTNVHLGRQLSGDSEADYFALADDDSRSAKIYKQPEPGREKKLRAMIDNAPATHSPYSAICWPQALIYNVEQELCGFIAPRFDASPSWPLLWYWDPVSRRKIPAPTTWRALVHIAMNLSDVMEAVHAKGHVIGDINKKNLFVSEDGRVSLVDCESISVKDGSSGRRYATVLGNKALTPAELQGMSGEVQREPTADRFMLAVAIFLLLMEGTHPCNGTWRGGGASPAVEENIKEGRYAYARWGYLTPGPDAPPFEMLPPVLGKLFERCFTNRQPSDRPTAGDWRYALEQLDRQLQTCRSNPQHIYSGHLSQCPWCGFMKERASAFTTSAHRQVLVASEADRQKARSGASPTPQPAVESRSRSWFRWGRSAQ